MTAEVVRLRVCCLACDGTGQLPENIVQLDDGAGRTDTVTEWGDCPLCHGSGRVDCERAWTLRRGSLS